MRRLWIAPLLAAVAVVPFLGCGTKATSTAWAGHTVGPKVAVSFAPLHCFAVNVVGDKGTVKSVLSTRGPHTAEIGTDERTMLETADVVFLNGLQLDDSIATALAAGGRGAAKPVKLGDRLKDEWLRHGEGHDHGPAAPGHDGHDHGEHDPHVWLSPTLAVELVKSIQAELRTKYPEYAADYDRNAAAYIAKLEKLTKDGRALLKGKKERQFATMHESLGYFADEFSLSIAGFLHKSPGVDPSGDELIALVDTCKKKGARVVAVEPQYSAAGAKTLVEALTRAGVADAALVELDPIETATAAEQTADLYETKMRANLAALNKVLK
jgi:ABC-type Zn uptake system ZnuABC Zn-binding protein ZnuA